MSIFLIPEIVHIIGKHLKLEELILLGNSNTYIYNNINKIISFDKLVNLQNLSKSVIYNILNNRNIFKLNMSNTMITDNFTGNISNCTELVLKNCFNLSDKFIDHIPNCKSLNLSYCPNITGSFIKNKYIWKKLKLSGCFFMDYNHFDDLHCEILDLTETIIIQEFTNQSYTKDHPFINALKRCHTIILSNNIQLINFIKNNDFNSEIIYKTKCTKYNPKETEYQKSYGAPGFISICTNYGYDNNLDISTKLVDKYLKDRVKYIGSISNNSYNDRMVILNKYVPLTSEFKNLLTNLSTISSNHNAMIYNNLFFRKFNTVTHDFYNNLNVPPELLDDNDIWTRKIEKEKNISNRSGFLGSKYVDSMFCTPKGQYENIASKYDNLLNIGDDNQLSNIIKLVATHLSKSELLTSNNCMLKYTDYDSACNDIYKYTNIMETLEKEFLDYPPLTQDKLDSMTTKITKITTNEYNSLYDNYMKERTYDHRKALMDSFGLK